VIPIGYHGKKGIKFDMFTLAKGLGPVGWAWVGLARHGSGLLPYTINYTQDGGRHIQNMNEILRGEFYTHPPIK
jgi:hypothetical protein